MANRESLNRRSFIKHMAGATIGGFGFLDACVTPYLETAIARREIGYQTYDIPSKQENQKPNVLLIMCDDLNDYSGAFIGHPQTRTPNIDRLAKS